MKLLIKILFSIFAILYTNISEAKVFVFTDVISETTFSNVFNLEKSKVELQNVFLENGFANTCKSENDLVDYRNLLLCIGATVAKGGINAVEQVAVHGNSLRSLRLTWGYKLYSADGTFLKNGITSKLIPERRYK